MKKFLAILLVCTVLLGLCAGCSKGNPTDTTSAPKDNASTDSAVKDENGKGNDQIGADLKDPADTFWFFRPEVPVGIRRNILCVHHIPYAPGDAFFRHIQLCHDGTMDLTVIPYNNIRALGKIFLPENLIFPVNGFYTPAYESV